MPLSSLALPAIPWAGRAATGETGKSGVAGHFMAAVADQFLRDYGGEPARRLDGPPISRIKFAEFSRDILGNLRRLHELHGPIAAIEEAGQRVVFLFSPEYNQQV